MYITVRSEDKNRQSRRKTSNTPRLTQLLFSKTMKMTKGLPLIILAKKENLVHSNGSKCWSTVAAKTELIVCHVSVRDF